MAIDFEIWKREFKLLLDELKLRIGVVKRMDPESTTLIKTLNGLDVRLNASLGRLEDLKKALDAGKPWKYFAEDFEIYNKAFYKDYKKFEEDSRQKKYSKNLVREVRLLLQEIVNKLMVLSARWPPLSEME